jgi:FkbM family methyltransferase
LAAYLKDFPRDEYDLHPTANGFSFFVEKGTAVDGIKKIISRGEVWEGYFLELMAKHIRPGSAVIDAGAYIGTHALAMARLVGPLGRVFAYEPQRKVFRELVYNIIENRARNVVPLRFALGDTTRVIEMGRPVNGIEANVGIGRGGDQAELRPLDSFGLSDVSFIKIDVEGYEDQVLDGARRTVAENGHPPILVEIQSAVDYDSAPPEIRSRIEGTVARLEDMGYLVAPQQPRDYLATPGREYPLGSVISLSDTGNGDSFKSGWWGPAEPWGAWTVGHSASLILPLASPAKRDLLLTARVRAFVGPGHPRQEVEILVNGRPMSRWVFRTGDERRERMTIPASALPGAGEDPVLRLTFRVLDPRSPAELKLSTDERRLGLGVSEVLVRESPEESRPLR